ncbi:SPOCS domain-containing protein [uncultured Clostridium sp.]|uniref:SPOCS domain-containing protein n=1 Tax=uncultured Clostridium sp. TaxID=59620 RepID=UPI0028EB5D27|nr:SPOCS domain-containing protein [uncultured Clostridium sp.]
MNDYKILVNGVTSSREISRNLRNIPYSKIVQTNILKLSYRPYEISRVLSVDMTISLKTFKKTKLDSGCKVNIIGFRNININYIAENSNKKVHELNYKIPFSTEIKYLSDDISVKNIYVPIDKISVKLLDPKQLIVTSSVYIAPLVGQS